MSLLSKLAIFAASFATATTFSLFAADEIGKLPDPETLKPVDGIPDVRTMLDGKKVETPSQWAARAKEISDMYQYYMYGVWRDGSDEIVTYTYNQGNMKINIMRVSTGLEVSMNARVSLPNASNLKMPEGGWPVVVGMHGGISEQTAVSRGYAVITINTNEIAVDNNQHQGIFYQLYPYDEKDWKTQTGDLLAWGWGCSKVLDALEAGAAKDLKINPKNSIVTGVSRWGKATMACGAYEKRFKMVMPSCSGTGGVAMFRYLSKDKTYDFTSKGGSATQKFGANEQLSNLHHVGAEGWFNEIFKKLQDPKALPFDQHMLCSLAADPNRYLFIIGSCVGEDWVNSPSMWVTYRATRSLYEFLGIGDNIICNIHYQGHAVLAEDMNYAIDYFNQKVYGIPSPRDLTPVSTSVYELPQNKDPLFDSFGGSIPTQPNAKK